jgi:hypothetical protein
MNKWLKLLIPDGETGGNVAVAEPPASAPAPEPAASTPPEPQSAPETAPVPTERTSPITADVAEQLGVTSPKPFKVDALKALGLDKSPREAIAAAIAKDAAKITRNVPFEKPKPAAPPVAITPVAGQAPVVPPVVKPVAPAPPQPATSVAPAPQKFKVGDQEMTGEQLAAFVQGLQARSTQPQPATSVPTQPTAPARSPEQEREFVRQRETQFVNETAPAIDLNIAGLKTTPEQADILAAGGQPAAALRDEMNQKAVAYATLLARKTIAAELNPIIKTHAQAIQSTQQETLRSMTPVIEHMQSLAAFETEQQFAAEYPDLLPHIDTARIIGHELVRQYPDWARQVSRAEFCKAIAEQTPVVLQRFGVTLTPKAPAPAPASNASPTPASAPNKPIPVKTPTSTGPKPITGQRPGGSAAAVTKPAQGRQAFQKVAIDSVSALR